MDKKRKLNELRDELLQTLTKINVLLDQPIIQTPKRLKTAQVPSFVILDDIHVKIINDIHKHNLTNCSFNSLIVFFNLLEPGLKDLLRALLELRDNGYLIACDENYTHMTDMKTIEEYTFNEEKFKKDILELFEVPTRLFDARTMFDLSPKYKLLHRTFEERLQKFLVKDGLVFKIPEVKE